MVKQQLTDATTKIQSDGMKNVSNKRFAFVVTSQWYIQTNTLRSRLFYSQIAQSFVNETVNIIDMFVKDVKYKVT